MLEAHSGEWAVFQQFSFYFHILESSISHIKDEFLLEKKNPTLQEIMEKTVAINVKESWIV